MVDKLDVAIPRSADFSRTFRVLRGALMKDPQKANRVFKPGIGTGYQRISDLRPVGLPVRLSENNLRSAKGESKIEIFDAGELTQPDWHDRIQEIFDVDAADMRILRVDLTADIFGVPVEWFRQNVTVKFKQRNEQLNGERRIAQLGAETVYYGKKPNQFRVYDKTGERIHQMKKERRKLPRNERWPDGELADRYMDRFDHDMRWKLTRVERQMGGGDPARNKLHRVGDLERLPWFYPYTRMALPEDAASPMLAGLTYRNECMVLDLQRRIRENGMAATKQFFSQRIGRGRAAAEWKKLLPFVCCDSQTVNHNRLRHEFMASTLTQLRGGRVA